MLASNFSWESAVTPRVSRLRPLWSRCRLDSQRTSSFLVDIQIRLSRRLPDARTIASWNSRSSRVTSRRVFARRVSAMLARSAAQSPRKAAPASRERKQRRPQETDFEQRPEVRENVRPTQRYQAV